VSPSASASPSPAISYQLHRPIGRIGKIGTHGNIKISQTTGKLGYKRPDGNIKISQTTGKLGYKRPVGGIK